MREYTQTSFAPMGNCWQTAVACLLEVDPRELPDQTVHDCKLVDGAWIGMSYNNALQGYLRKHHGLAYVDLGGIPEEGLAMLQLRDPGWHLISGRTNRSEQWAGLHHIVVGRYGQIAWDPHPSRAGLTGDFRWSLIVPLPKAWAEGLPLPCVCPACSAG